MSVYLYLHCLDCEQYSDVIGRNTTHEDGLEDNLGILKWALYREAKVFLVKHKGHRVMLIDENARYPNEWPGWGQSDARAP